MLIIADYIVIDTMFILSFCFGKAALLKSPDLDLDFT